MKYQPFSVAMSVYKNDNSVYFDRALESITDQQTIKPNEIVLVVDGPVPKETDGVIEKYSKKYNLKVIRLETNGGLGNALRIATENCSNELIARMDSDDVATADRFEQQLQFVSNNPDVDIVGGNISEFIDDETNIVSFRVVPATDEKLKKFMKKRCPFNHMTVMFKKASVMNAGGYVDLHFNEDYFLWIRMSLNKSVFANIKTILVNVRIGKNMYARRGGRKYFSTELKLQKYLLENKVISFFTFVSNVCKRFVVQVLITNKMRAFVFKKFARKTSL